jgi:hypothetical protein
VTEHLRFVVEKEGKTSLLTTKELEVQFQITYAPHLDFAKLKIYQKLCRKTIKFHRKGMLDEEQLWLGSYFQKEILSAPLPAVRLRWIDEKLGWGVFAERDLPNMEYIGEYAGIVRKRKRSDAKNAYCFEYVIAEGEHSDYNIDALDQGGLVRFINHSDKPNLTSALATARDLSHVIFYTKKPVSKGEQLCYHYGPVYWTKRSAPQNI